MKDSARKAGNAAGTRPTGFYDKLFDREELRWLELHPQINAEQDLLRTLVRRLAKLLPLKELDDDQLNALLKLVRVVAMIDALERTEVMRRKGGLSDDPLLRAIAVDDLEDL